jgi:hypothetical protein
VTERNSLEEVKGQIRRRLRLICAHMEENVFEELVAKIAENELKALHRSQHWGTKAASARHRDDEKP